MAYHRDKRREDQRSAYKSVRHRTGCVQRQRRATKSVHKEKREEKREYCSGQCSCDHCAQTGTNHQPHELTRVGSESRANSELASPPGHRIPHCSIDSEQGQETRYASYKQQHLADYPSLLGVVVHLRAQRAGNHQHLRIEIARNMFHRCRDGIGIAVEAYENEITASRNGAQHINARAIGLGVYPVYVSRTTPSTRRRLASGAMTSLPIGSCAGQNALANDWEIITAFSSDRVLRNTRPSTSGTPTVAK